MSKSEPKPKIIYKNLEDLIKGSSINQYKKPYTQRAKPQSLCDITNMQEQSRTMAPSNNYLDSQPQHFREPSHSAAESNIYRQLDNSFAELEDFFIVSKNRVISQVRTLLQEKGDGKQAKVQDKMEEIRKMSEYIRHITNFFVNGDIPKFNANEVPTGLSSCQFMKNTSDTEELDECAKMTMLSMQNSKLRANRRGQVLSKKKTVYQLILQEKQRRIRLNSSSKSKLKH